MFFSGSDLESPLVNLTVIFFVLFCYMLLVSILVCCRSLFVVTISVAENLGEQGGAEAPPPPLRIVMNIHSMKLFNNLIKNTLLAPMFCSLVKS